MDKQNLTKIPWTLSGSTLAMVLNGKPVTMESDHPNFAAVLSALRCGEWDLVEPLANVAAHILKLADGRIQVAGDELFYLGQPLANSLTDRILTMIREGAKNLTPMCNFLENCMANPNKGAVDRIFTFLEKSHLPLTPDGCFLAYRGVDSDFKARHQGMWDDEGKYQADEYYDNTPGKIVRMPRKECDEDSHSCCSRGLHFCSLPYLGPVGNWAGGSDNIIVVKINPRDVVAVPYTYSDTKGRCCRFEVLRVWQAADQFKDLTKDAWEVSLVAESEEVTDPTVRAMLNLERINEVIQNATLDNPANDEDSDDYVDDYEGDYASGILPENGVQTIFEGMSWTKDTRRNVVMDLYRAALRANEPAFAFQASQDHKTPGDLKVTPKGSVLVYEANPGRWSAFFQINAK